MPNPIGRLKAAFGTLCVGIVFGMMFLNPAESLQLPDGAEEGTFQNDILCRSCESYANKLRRFQAEHYGLTDCSYIDDGYTDFKTMLFETILYEFDINFDAATAESEKLQFTRLADHIETDMCDGISTAKICRKYQYCVCTAGSYSFEYHDSYYDQGAICLKCPEGQMSLPTGDNDITSCYRPANTGFSDSAGSGVVTGDCHWKN